MNALCYSGTEVGAEDIMTLLHPFCAEEDAAGGVEARLRILQMLEQCFSLVDTDLGRLLSLYRTQAVLNDAWGATREKVCHARFLSLLVPRLSELSSQCYFKRARQLGQSGQQ